MDDHKAVDDAVGYKLVDYEFTDDEAVDDAVGYKLVDYELTDDEENSVGDDDDDITDYDAAVDDDVDNDVVDGEDDYVEDDYEHYNAAADDVVADAEDDYDAYGEHDDDDVDDEADDEGAGDDEADDEADDEGVVTTIETEGRVYLTLAQAQELVQDIYSPFQLQSLVNNHFYEVQFNIAAGFLQNGLRYVTCEIIGGWDEFLNHHENAVEGVEIELRRSQNEVTVTFV